MAVDVEGFAASGVLTRTVADTAAALDVLARYDPAAWWPAPSPTGSFASAMMTEPSAGLRIGVLADSPIDGITVEPACKVAVDATLRILESAGHHVIDTPLPLPSAYALIGAFTTIWNIGGAGIPLADPDRVEPHNRALRDAARMADSWAYAQSLRDTKQLSRDIVEGFLARFDILVTPTMACLPPPVGAWRAGTDGNALMAMLNSYPMAMFTTVFNVTGQPAISVPVHHDEATGLPVGVQIVAPPWREDLLLQVCRVLELACPWRDRRPPVS